MDGERWDIPVVSLRMVQESTVPYYVKGQIRKPSDMYEMLRELIGDRDREVFVIVCLSSRGFPTHVSVCSMGSLNQSIVHPREVFKVAIMANASSIIVAHNHPSGEVVISEQDKEVTRKLKEAGQILGISLLDHIIVGNECVSLTEQGFNVVV